MLALLDVAITIRCAAKHVHTASLGAMPFAAPRSLGDLRPLIFGNHSLKLQHEPLLGGFAAGGFQKDRLHTMTGKFLDQQNLISVLTTQAMRDSDLSGDASRLADLACADGWDLSPIAEVLPSRAAGLTCLADVLSTRTPP